MCDPTDPYKQILVNTQVKSNTKSCDFFSLDNYCDNMREAVDYRSKSVMENTVTIDTDA